MLQGVSWLLLGREGIYSQWFWQAQGTKCTQRCFRHYWPLSKRRTHESVRQPNAHWLGFCGFTDQRQRDAIKETSRAKDLQWKRDRKNCSVKCMWRSPRELVYQDLVQPRKKGESWWWLLSFLLGVFTSLRTSFILCAIEIMIVPPLEGVVRMKVGKVGLWDRITGSTPKLLSNNLGDTGAQACVCKTAILLPKSSLKLKVFGSGSEAHRQTKSLMFLVKPKKP